LLREEGPEEAGVAVVAEEREVVAALRYNYDMVLQLPGVEQLRNQKHYL
jgi:hypothetical protein